MVYSYECTVRQWKTVFTWLFSKYFYKIVPFIYVERTQNKIHNITGLLFFDRISVFYFYWNLETRLCYVYFMDIMWKVRHNTLFCLLIYVDSINRLYLMDSYNLLYGTWENMKSKCFDGVYANRLSNVIIVETNFHIDFD